MSIVHFDSFPALRHFGRVSQSLANGAVPGPAYDIESHGDDGFVIQVALPGYQRDELEISFHDHNMTVKGCRNTALAENAQVLHKGIPTDSFVQSFRLGDHVEVVKAELDSGILRIDLVRRIPEALKPRTISIGQADRAA